MKLREGDQKLADSQSVVLGIWISLATVQVAATRVY